MGDKQVSLKTENNNIESFLFLVCKLVKPFFINLHSKHGSLDTNYNTKRTFFLIFLTIVRSFRLS